MNELTLNEEQFHRLLWEISNLKIENQNLRNQMEVVENIQELMERRLHYLIERIKQHEDQQP